MKSYEEIYEIVKASMSEKRFKHSEKVMERCVEFAKLYGEDVEKAKLIGIAHDIAKEIPKDRRVEEAEKVGTVLDDFEKKHTSLIHAKHGAVICRDQFGFSEDMCEAVSYHSTAKPNMTKLDKILFLADFCEETREFPEAKVAYEKGKKDLEDGYLYTLGHIIKFMVDDRTAMNKITIDAFNDMVK